MPNRGGKARVGRTLQTLWVHNLHSPPSQVVTVLATVNNKRTCLHHLQGHHLMARCRNFPRLHIVTNSNTKRKVHIKASHLAILVTPNKPTRINHRRRPYKLQSLTCPSNPHSLITPLTVPAVVLRVVRKVSILMSITRIKPHRDPQLVVLLKIKPMEGAKEGTATKPPMKVSEGLVTTTAPIAGLEVAWASIGTRDGGLAKN